MKKQINNQIDDQTAVLQSIVEVLNRIRSEKHISLSQLAQDAKLSKSTVSDTLSGNVSPYTHTLLSICAAMQVSLADVLMEVENAKRSDGSRHQVLSFEEIKMLDVYRAAPQDYKLWLRQCIGLLERTQSSG